MNTETADHMKDVIAFLVARSKDDEEAALAIIGMKLDPGYKPTEEEEIYTANQAMKLIIGLADFALSEIEVLAILLRTNPDALLRKFAMGMAMFGG